MRELFVPQSPDKLSERLKTLHNHRKKHPPALRRVALRSEERATVLAKTAGRCHLCGGDVGDASFAADHVLAHAAGGAHAIDNYLAAHRICNGCRWFYSPEELQWILKIGVWARKQMEDRTPIGKAMLDRFVRHAMTTAKRRKASRR